MNIFTAIEKNKYEIIKQITKKNPSLINSLNEYNDTPLHFACRQDNFNINIIKLLIENNANVNTVNDNNDTVLHLLSKHDDDNNYCNNDTEYLEKIIDEWNDIIEYILNKDITVETINAINNDNENAIFLTYNNYKAKNETQKLLLLKGITIDNINTKSGYNNQTLLMHACEHGNKHDVLFLLSKGANVNEKDIAGMNALIIVALHNNVGNIGKILIDKGIEINKDDELEVMALEICTTKNKKSKTYNKLLNDFGMIIGYTYGQAHHNFPDIDDENEE